MTPAPDQDRRDGGQRTSDPEVLGRYLELLRAGDARAAGEHASRHADSRDEFDAVRTAWERLSPLFERLESVDLAERLRTRFGRAVDPGISLAGAPIEDPPPRGPAGEYRERFGRGGLAERRYARPREIARGGMGSIRRVWDNDLRRELVMKAMLLPSDRTDGVDTRPPDSRLLSRFLEEAQITSQLDHPGILPVHDIGVDAEGRLFFTMPLVKGEDLGRVIEKARTGEDGWDRTRVLGAVLKAMEAVAFAHSRGVVHRDLKPENIMVGRFGETYVMDWGLARVLQQARREQPVSPTTTIAAVDELRSRGASMPAPEPRVRTDRSEDGSADATHATLDGDVIGTPGYMAPEQARGEREAVGPLADVYSFGAILYQLLTGHRPFDDPIARKSGLHLLERVLSSTPTPVRKLAPDQPDELIAICEKAMRADPTQRYGSMLELLEDLRAYLEGRVVRAHDTSLPAEVSKWIRRNRLAATILAVSLVLGAVGAGLFVWQLQTSLDAQEQLVATAEGERERAEEQAAAAREARRAAEREAARALEAGSEAEAARLAAERIADELRREKEQTEAERRLALLQSYAANLSAVQASIADDDLSEARRRLATCPEDLRGWEFEHLSQRVDMSLRVHRDASAHRDGVRDVAVAPDGQIASVGTDGVRTWDGDSGEPLEQWALRGARAVAFEPAGESLVVLDDDGRVLRLRPGRSDVELVLDGERFLPQERVPVALSPDGRVLALGRVQDEGAVVELLDLERRRVSLVTLPAEYEVVSALSWRPGDARLAAGLRDGLGRHLLAVLDTRDPRVIDTVELAGTGDVTDVAFDPTGRFVAGCSASGELVVWDYETLEVPLYQSSSERGLVSTTFGRDAELVYAGTSSGTIEVWELGTGTRRLLLRGHDGAAVRLVHDPLRDQIVSASLDGTLRSWPPASGDVVQSVRVGAASPFGRLSFARDGAELLVSDERGGEAWDASSLRLFAELDAEKGEFVDALALPGGSFAVGLTATADGWSAGLWSTATGGGPVRELASGTGEPHALALSDLGDLAVAFDPRGERAGGTRVVVHALGTGLARGAPGALGPPSVLEDLQSPVVALAYDRGGRRLACGHADGTISLLGARPLALLGRLVPPRVALERRGARLVRELAQSVAARAAGGLVELDDGERGAASLRAVRHLAFDPQGPGLVAGTAEGVVRLWDTESGALVREFVGHEGPITALSFHPDSGRFASAATDGTVRVWSTELGESLLVLRGHEGAVVDATFDPRGRRLASLDAQGGVRLHETEPQLDRYAVRRGLDADMESALPVLVELLDGLARQGPGALRDLLGVATPVQQTVVNAARLLGSRPAPLHDRAWEVASRPGATQREYDSALRYARAAALLLPGNPIYQRTLGVALYRAGQLGEARAVLTASSAAHPGGPRPEELAVLGLIEARQGRLQEAWAWLQRLDATLADPLWADDEVARSFRSELSDRLER